MVPAFSAALGVSLCTFGLAVMWVGGTATGYPLANAHDVVFIVSGILALMVAFERRRVARRVWTVIATLHAAMFLMWLTGLVEARSGNLALSVIVSAACLIATRSARSPRRQPVMLRQRFDERLAPERAESVPVHAGGGG